MRRKKKFLISFLFSLVFNIHTFQCQTSTFKIRTISFYNVENLFDTINNPDTFDDDYTIQGKNHYSSKIYQKKIENIGQVISKIGFETTNMSPVLIGLSEIENTHVLEDLINSSSLRGKRYKILHFDSPDRRGIDVALLYREKYFTPLRYKSFEVKIWDEKGQRIYTRDQLLVSGFLDTDLIHVIVNHWPSRRGGQQKSSAKRKKAAYVTQQIIDEIRIEDSNAKIIIMGDFNDDPMDASIKESLNSCNDPKRTAKDQLYNPMENMYKDGLNSLGYRDGINLFDQILMTPECLSSDNNYTTYKFFKAGIFNPQYLITQKGRYKGYPFRSFQNNSYTGGYSDHFPVYIYLIKKN